MDARISRAKVKERVTTTCAQIRAEAATVTATNEKRTSSRIPLQLPLTIKLWAGFCLPRTSPEPVWLMMVQKSQPLRLA